MQFGMSADKRSLSVLMMSQPQALSIAATGMPGTVIARPCEGRDSEGGPKKILMYNS